MRAFEALVAATRDRTPYEVKTSLVVEVTEEGETAVAPVVEATLRFDPSASPRRAQLSLRGFDILLRDGKMVVRHASNEREYVSIDDAGAPYETLRAAFMDLPYPHLGMLMGERDASAVLSQLSMRAGGIVPTRVEMVERETEPPRPLQRLHLTGEFEQLELDVDPSSHAIESVRLAITGGPMVRAGSTMKLTLACVESPLTGAEAVAPFAFDPGERRRVDSILALPRAAERGSTGGFGGGASEPTLIGKRAPDLSILRMDDGEVDLANFRGRKVVVLDFWATWCGPCRVGLPKLDVLTRALTERGVAVTVVAVNTLEGVEGEELRRKVAAFWADKNYTMTLALDESGEAAEAFGVRALPTTVVIGLDGLVHWQHIGLTENMETELAAAVEAALQPFAGHARVVTPPGAPPPRPPNADDADAQRAPEQP